MKATDLEQVKIIIANIDKNNKKIPYFSDLQKHAVYGPFFQDLDAEDILEIQDLILEYAKEKVLHPSTKGGEMFKRFYVMNQERFWRFRELNSDETFIETEEFQKIGKEIEQELFKFEGILTKNMMKKAKGLDKTISAFYDIVYSFFPLFGQVK